MARQIEEVSLAQAAQRLGVSWHRAYRLALTGKLEARLIAGRWLVTSASVDRALKGIGKKGGSDAQ
jgi:hypothetical protein